MIPKFKIYLVTDSKLFPRPAAMLKRIRYLLEIAPRGSTAICLRENHLEDRRLLDLALRLRRLTARRGALLLINRRADVALFDEWGDRPPRTQIVAIGAPGAIDTADLTERFNTCLNDEARI